MTSTQNTMNMPHSEQMLFPNRTSETSVPFTRVAGSVALGAIMTFGIFVVMHLLIKQDASPVAPPEPIVMVSSILDIEDKPIVERKPLPKPQEVPEIPDSPAIEPIKADPSIGFSNKVIIPSTKIAKTEFNVAPVDQQPRPLVRVPPSYPSRPASNGIEGFVELRFGVSPSGSVVDIEVVNAEPRNTFERSAKRALSKWKYQPKLVAGQAVGMSGLQVRLDFTLANDG